MESNLKKLKQNYSEIQKKYELPEFNDLNKEFGIEKLSKNETDFLLRNIRKIISETMENFISFVELILNPVNAPLFLYSFIKCLSEEEKKTFQEIHSKITKFEIESMKLIIYDEKQEAEFIKNSLELWNNIKTEFVKVVENVEKKMDIKTEKSKRNYFG